MLIDELSCHAKACLDFDMFHGRCDEKFISVLQTENAESIEEFYKHTLKPIGGWTDDKKENKI